MDPYRLPRHIVPTRYDIRLEPDLPAGTFTGEETITLTVHHPVSAPEGIVLNAAAEPEFKVQNAEIEGEAGGHETAAVTQDGQTERCRLTFRNPILPGTWRLRLRFAGSLTGKDGKEKMAGFYRSTYKDDKGAERWLAATQFEPTDARQAFPCWDEPDFKAVFSLTLVIDPSRTAVSNTPVIGEGREGGKKVVRFADTIPLSTYLVAFAVGDLRATEPVWVGRTPLRVWYAPESADAQQLTPFAQRVGKAALEFYESYYGLPYPGGKLDLLAIPDFAAGAMENLGAITFRQSRLLINEAEASRAELQNVADTVAHECAHLWFGDLVTMSWWNGLWLNEAFATFMEALSVNHWKPAWQRWEAFSLAERTAALWADGLHNTRPIEFEMADDPHDIMALFDDITYRKGASVLRMLEQHLDPDVFQAGVRDYLRQHAYGNATTDDLWAALGRAAGRDLGPLLDSWVRRPGYPLIRVRLDPDARQLVLTQERFTYLNKRPSDLPDEAESAGKHEQASPYWQVPLRLGFRAGGQTTTRQVLLGGDRLRLELPDGFEAVQVNEGGHGFYRVRYDRPSWQALLPLLPQLTAGERLNLINDAWAAVLMENEGGRLPLADYLELAVRMTGPGRDESDPNVWLWPALIRSLEILNRIVEPTQGPNLAAFVSRLIRPAFDRLGWEPPPDEGDLSRRLRHDLLLALGTLGDDREVQGRGAKVFQKYKGNPAAVDGDMVAAVIPVLAHVGDAACYDEFFALFKSPSATPLQQERYLDAFARFQKEDLLEQTRKHALNPRSIRSQDAPSVLRALLLSVAGRDGTWKFIQGNWQEMADRYGQSGLGIVCAGLSGLDNHPVEEVVQAVKKVRIKDRSLQQFLGGKALAQDLEQLRIFVGLRQREQKNLHDYLAASTKR